ncbi:hypothetical protein I4F81_000369 [Pyropia yezoensis]|uniref:Uncharacterized protein n=1 Tax=Pyropia yezoensis TaxID=2788 RepID=A0ACC3BJ10_PYRYE|nr:hypothetical protein I4F81_000369 [Neopyropia yezoensis]
MAGAPWHPGTGGCVARLRARDVAAALHAGGEAGRLDLSVGRLSLADRSPRRADGYEMAILRRPPVLAVVFPVLHGPHLGAAVSIDAPAVQLTWVGGDRGGVAVALSLTDVEVSTGWDAVAADGAAQHQTRVAIADAHAILTPDQLPLTVDLLAADAAADADGAADDDAAPVGLASLTVEAATYKQRITAPAAVAAAADAGDGSRDDAGGSGAGVGGRAGAGQAAGGSSQRDLTIGAAWLYDARPGVPDAFRLAVDLRRGPAGGDGGGGVAAGAHPRLSVRATTAAARRLPAVWVQVMAPWVLGVPDFYAALAAFAAPLPAAAPPTSAAPAADAAGTAASAAAAAASASGAPTLHITGGMADMAAAVAIAFRAAAVAAAAAADPSPPRPAAAASAPPSCLAAHASRVAAVVATRLGWTCAILGSIQANVQWLSADLLFK